MADYNPELVTEPDVQPNTLMPETGLPPSFALPALPAPAMPRSPVGDLGSILMGFAAGTQGRLNPIVAFEEQQRQRALNQQLALAELQLRERARLVQEKQFDLNQKIEERRLKTDEEHTQIQREKMQQDMGLRLIDAADPALRVQGYKMLQQAGKLGADADPEKLALLSKVDFNMARDEAIGMLEAGMDPSDPSFGGRYNFLPIDKYKELAQKNPLGLNQLRSKPMPEDQALKAVVARIASMPEAAVRANPDLQRQMQGALSALTLSAKVNYGERVNAELAAMGVMDPRGATPPQVAEAIRRASVEQGPPTLERIVARQMELEQKIANAKSPEEFAALKDVKENLARVQAHKEALVQAQSEVVGAKTKAAEAEKPFPAAVQSDLDGYQSVLSTAKEFRTFTPEEIKKYTGVLRNPAMRAKNLIADTIGVGTVDPRFAQFQTIMGQFQNNYFKLGGKQLTGMEMRVASLSTPTGTEAGGAAEMLAKASYLEKFTRITRDVRLTLAKTGKGYVDADLMDRMLEDGMRKAGLGIPSADNPTPWMPKVEAPSGYKAAPGAR